MDPSARDELRLMAAVAAHSPDGYLLVDASGTITWASPQVRDLLGYEPEALRGRSVDDLVSDDRSDGHADQRRGVRLDVLGAMGSGRYLEALAADGSLRPFDIRLSRFDDDRVLVVLRDAVDRKVLEDGLRQLAESDPLTGLANRRVVLGDIEAAMARTRRRGDCMGVCYLDLDRFKPINDRYGHEAGDQVLRAVARALQASVRQGDLVGRVGGDEFVVVMEQVGDDPDGARVAAVEIARRALAAVARPVHYAGSVLEPQASAGVAVTCRDGDGDDLLRAADRALYEAKSGGATGTVVFASASDG